MINILKILNILLVLLILYDLIYVLVKQYYSFKRATKAFSSYLGLMLVILIGLDLATIFLKGYYFYIAHLFISCLYLFILKIKWLKFSRRSVVLFISTGSLTSIIFFISPRLLIIKLMVIALILLTVFYLLIPLENRIKHKYLLLAKKKLEKYPNLKIIGITGSFGKSSFRNYLVTALKIKYLVNTPKNNVNTLMGITKYINQEFSSCDILVLELGIDEVNQMEKFKQILKLDYAIITSIGNMHLSSFKNMNNLINEKLKIKNLLKQDGMLFLNQNNQYLKDIKGENIVFYNDENITCVNQDINGIKLKYLDNNYLFPIHQNFFITYFGGIIKICNQLGINEESLYFNSNKFSDFARRNQVFKIEKGYLIDNSYNANVEGISSSLKLLDTLIGESYIITGGIIEQGSNFDYENTKLKELFKNQNIIFIGKNKHPLIKNHEFNKLIRAKNLKDAYKIIRDINPDNVLLLAKGEDIYLR